MHMKVLDFLDNMSPTFLVLHFAHFTLNTKTTAGSRLIRMIDTAPKTLNLCNL